VIGGAAGGVPLRGPRDEATRPTASRLREALFSMLESAGADNAEVLDLYAGTGALGVEALSRGAERATFVESDARACAVIRENLMRTGLAEQANVVRGRVGRWRPPEGARYTIVLADPPYDDAAAAWIAIERSVEGALAPHAILVVEHSARSLPPSAVAGLPLWRDRRQGEGAVAIYRAKSEDTPRGEDA
jgi:16S rRNA (guanine966-N2)-methyltransferase